MNTTQTGIASCRFLQLAATMEAQHRTDRREEGIDSDVGARAMDYVRGLVDARIDSLRYFAKR